MSGVPAFACVRLSYIWVVCYSSVFGGWVLGFLKDCLDLVSRRALLLVALNLLFFCSIIAGALLGRYGYGEFAPWPIGKTEFAESLDLPLLIVAIFALNLVASAFIVITLPGLVFFALPAVLLVLRGLLWGLLFGGASTSDFLLALPTLVLEGEAYVFAALAGVNLGLSWLKPSLLYPGERLLTGERLPRSVAVGLAFRECFKVYVFVAGLLLVAAVVEAVTIVLLG